MSLPSLVERDITSAFLKPLQLYHGRVLSSYQNGTYEVVTDAGRITAYAHGGSRGVLGASDSGLYLSGQEVIVAIHVGLAYGVIVGSAGILSADRGANGYAVDSLSYPRLTGYQYDKRFGGKIRKEQLARSPNQRKVGLMDLVDGEWAMSTPFGAAVAVEHFRAMLRAAPFAKVECYGEEDPLLKLVGARLEQMTMYQEYQDGRLFNTGQQIDRRTLLPAEALEDEQPRVLRVAGIAHGGEHTFVLPQPTTYAKSPNTHRRRFGLFHEFTSYTGEYLLEAAGSVTLRKTCAIRAPDEIRPGHAAILAPDTNTASQHKTVEDTPREGLTPAANPDHPQEPEVHAPLAAFTRVLEYVENLSWRGRNAFNRLDKSWTIGTLPDEVAGPDLSKPLSQAYTGSSSSMWHVTPRMFEIELDPKLGKKKFYVGSACISLCGDGSIVLEDAYHSQIVMSKGNIRIAADKDLLLESGRNCLLISGNDAAVRSYRHLDLAANSGRLHIKADQQLNLLGGNSGSGGVLVESRSVDASPSVGIGQAQMSGGVVLMSQSGISAAAPMISLYADSNNGSADRSESDSGAVIIHGHRNVYISTPSLVASYGGSLAFSFLGTNTGASIGPNQTVLHGLVADTVCDLSAGGTSDAMRSADEQAAILQQAFASDSQQFGGWTSPIQWKSLGFNFCTTKDLGLEPTYSFMIPQPEWSRHNVGAQNSTTWIESPVFSLNRNETDLDGTTTCPYPGYQAWMKDSRYLRLPENGFYRIADGTLDSALDTDDKLDEEGELDTPAALTSSSVKLPLTTTAPINGNYPRRYPYV
jgi:hypothetical protein